MRMNYNDTLTGVPGVTYIVTSPEQYERLMATGRYLCFRAVYADKKWWQFWKRKKPVGYELMCIK